MTNTIEKTKETFGEKLAKIHTDTTRQEVGETYNEVSKEWLEKIKSIISENQKIHGKYYIQIVQKREPYSIQVIKHVFFVRRSRPIPEHDMYLYSMNNDTGKFQFEWCIPDKKTIEMTLLQPFRYPKEFVDMLRSYQKGTLR
jgi:hypothetical protein